MEQDVAKVRRSRRGGPALPASPRRPRAGVRSPARVGLASAVAIVATAVLAVAVLAAAGPVAPAQARAAVTETYPLPTSGAWALAGKGFGHGRGMSQWGSQGAALRGLSGSQILSFYYPGTVTTTIAAASIRVLLSSDDGADTAVGAQPGLAVRDVATALLYTLPAGPTRWRAVHDSAGMHLDSWNGTAWSRWAAPDGRSTWPGPLRFGAGPTAIMTLYIGQTAARYRGSLTAVPTGTTTVATVNTLAMDLYLRSVVPAESPASWLAAALRAQAVAARTFAAYGRAHSTGQQWDTCDTTACQVYRGVASEATSTTTAVLDTANQIRTLSGQPILAQFSSSNGGWTVAGSPPYQVAKPDPYDAAGGANPNSNWTVPLAAADLRTRYPEVGSPTALRVVARDGNGAWGGRVTDLYLDGTAGSVHLPGDQSRLTLRSTWWIPRPTVSGPATVSAGSVVSLRGTARSGAAVEVWFQRGTEPTYVKRRTLTADSAGRWSTAYVAADDYRYYAVSYGVRGPVGETQIPN
jgi:stage II sporulation protein D